MKFQELWKQAILSSDLVSSSVLAMWLNLFEPLNNPNNARVKMKWDNEYEELSAWLLVEVLQMLVLLQKSKVGGVWGEGRG